MKEHKEKEEIREEEPEVSRPQNEADPGTAGIEVPDESAEEMLTESRLADLEKENAELKDQYLRKVADFDNYRKRMIREKQEAFEYANTGLLTDLIAILDDFDRALAASAESGENHSIIDGIRMINKQMRGLLEAKYYLSCYTVEGDLFDPNIHEAIASTPAAVAEPVIAEVYLKGYMLRDRVIRPAKVLVHMPDGSVTESALSKRDNEPDDPAHDKISEGE
ncbi:MAG: nucleotide exchange factor GrpE [Spirochaetaceae bacterium]|jgi:molecular chaperone GrpE|nr:nucleotide exchange factor GrpE [Spirochaetaceae bacterium]